MILRTSTELPTSALFRGERSKNFSTVLAEVEKRGQDCAEPGCAEARRAGTLVGERPMVICIPFVDDSWTSGGFGRTGPKDEGQ